LNEGVAVSISGSDARSDGSQDPHKEVALCRVFRVNPPLKFASAQLERMSLPRGHVGGDLLTMRSDRQPVVTHGNG
jgi:hypothetical protein